jgi:F-type H+-transporting ATPase subunit alpha
LKLRPEEITSILKERIEQFDVETDLAEVGAVLQVGDGIARIYGLENAVSTEMLELEHGVSGIAFNLEEDNVGAALFGEWELISEGQPVKRTGEVASIPVGDALVGRIVDPLGNPLDGQGPIETTERRPLEFKAPGVVDRQPEPDGQPQHDAERQTSPDRPRCSAGVERKVVHQARGEAEGEATQDVQCKRADPTGNP